MTRRHVRVLATAALGTLLVGVPSGCGGSAEHTAAPAHEVVVADFSFGPRTIEVAAGTTVTWRSDGATTHNVKGRGFFSRALEPGGSYSHRFARAGRFPYLCTLHPQLMKGVVVVR